MNLNADHRGIRTLIVIPMDDETGEASLLIWERILLESGYDVVDRKRLETILNERSLAMSGMTDNPVLIKEAELAGADAVLFVSRWGFARREVHKLIYMSMWTIRMVSVKTGQMLFVASKASFTGNLASDASHVSWDWPEKIWDHYRTEVDRMRR